MDHNISDEYAEIVKSAISLIAHVADVSPVAVTPGDDYVIQTRTKNAIQIRLYDSIEYILTGKKPKG